jgi:hypothetical protein
VSADPARLHELPAEPSIQTPTTPALVRGDGIVWDFVPRWAGEVMERRYASFFALPEYARIFEQHEGLHTLVLGDRAAAGSAALRGDEADAVVFTTKGPLAWVLTRLTTFTPGSVGRICDVLFAELLQVRQVRVEVLFPPVRLRRPYRVVLRNEDFILTLPPGPDDYEAALGQATRRNLRTYRNRLRRDHPDVSYRVVPGSQVAPETLRQLVDYNLERMSGKGLVSGFERHPEEEGQLLAILRRRGLLCMLEEHGRLVAGTVIFDVGDQSWMYMIAHDPGLSYYHPGLMVMSEAIRSCIERGRTVLHLGWTTGEYKQRLGAVRTEAATVLVYRTRGARLLNARQEAGIALEEARHSRWYWRLTHLPGIARRRLARLRRGGDDLS